MQETVGPYEVVIVRASMGEALDTWLITNGFDIPPHIQPILDSYVAQKLDFVAMKLRPGANVSAMRPVRVVEPGADPTLPLRMISAGAGAHVAIALWVISEGRYEPQNFPTATIDFSKLVYDVANKRSNYAELRAAALSAVAPFDAGATPPVVLEAGPAANAAADSPAALEAASDASTAPDAVAEAAPDAAPDAAAVADADSVADAGSDADDGPGPDAPADTVDADADAGAGPTESGATTDAAAGPVTAYWLTEFAGLANLGGVANGASGSSGSSTTPPLLLSYLPACMSDTMPNPCEAGVGDMGGDGAVEASLMADADAPPDGSGDALPDADAAESAAAKELAVRGRTTVTSAGEPSCTPPSPPACDDPQVAFTGLHTGSIWITRLVADLPYSALGRDLVLQAAPSQSTVDNVHVATSWIDGDPCTLGRLGMQSETITTTTRSHVPRTEPARATQSCALASRSPADALGACAIAGMTALWLARRSGRRTTRH